MKRAAIFALVSMGCASSALGPRPVPNDSGARDLACSLADEVGPRLAGTEGDARAVAWAIGKMTALGLQNVHAEKVTVTHWQRGEASAELVSPVTRKLNVVALGGSIATPDEGLEAEVISVASLEALAALPDDAVKGRIVFFDKVMERTASGQGYGKTVDVRRKGASDAAKKGAVASLIRSVGTGDSRFAHTGQMKYFDDAGKIPAGALSIPDAELLRRTLARGGPVRLKLRMTPRLIGDAESANVIGEVPGAVKPEEIVVLGAHLDSWDLGDGAIDDAAGIGIILDVARKLVKPERTVRIVLFANEESGLKGARAYAKEHEAEMPKHVAALEADSGAGLASGVVFKGGPEAEAAMAPLTAALEGLGLPAPRAGDAGGADTGELSGVPQVELDQDRARYFDLHHTADDTCDKIRADEIAQVAQVALLVTKHLAKAGVDLGRLPPPKPYWTQR